MLAVPADRLPGAIGDLDPGNRALLDLSLRRGVSDAEIGELLRKEPADVARGRDAVLELLADALDVGGHDRRDRVRLAVAALPEDAWYARPTPPPPPPPEVRLREKEPADERPEDLEPEPEPVAEPPGPPVVADDDFYFEPEEPRSRRGGLIAALGLLAVLVALGVVLLSGGDDDESDAGDQNGSQSAQNGGPEPGSEGNSEPLRSLGEGKDGGSITVTDEGATIVVRGLPKPDGVYQVWLYNSIVDAQSLGTLPDRNGKLEVTLPPDASEYRFVDVSNEPADGNPNHAGASVLRAPLRDLLSN